MLAIAQSKIATDTANMKIAEALCRQTFPLSDEGKALKTAVERVIELHDSSWLRANVGQLPAVENPCPHLFADLNFEPLGKEKVLGPELIVVQSHIGCHHQCEGFCDSRAPAKITSTMPFMGAYKIGEAKVFEARKIMRLMLNWFRNLERLGLRDSEERRLAARIRAMKTVGEFVKFLLAVDGLLDLHPINSYFRRWPTKEKLDLVQMWQNYWHYLPVLISSLRYDTLHFNGNDPTAYRDRWFRHIDGTKADYGDFFAVLTDIMRPGFVSTAGWLADDFYAERSMRKILALHKADDWLTAGVRLTVKRYVKLARTDHVAYMANLKRMIKMLWPLWPEFLIVQVYDDPRVEGDKEWSDAVSDELERYAVEELGGSLNIDRSVVSHSAGRAFDPRYWNDPNPAADVWGNHIYPNGRVYYQKEAVWKKVLDPVSGNWFDRLESPDIRREFTGVSLW